MDLNFTGAEKEIIKAKFKAEEPNRIWTNRENFFTRRSGLGDFSFYALRNLIKKGVVSKIEKPYHTYEAFQYRFTPEFVKHELEEIRKDQEADNWNYERQNGDFETF